MITPHDYEEVDRLTSALLDKVITEKDFRRLESILIHSPVLRRRYKSVVSLESVFHWENDSTFSPSDHSNHESKIAFYPLLAWVGSIAATLIIMAGSWWSFSKLHLFPDSFSLADPLVRTQASISSSEQAPFDQTDAIHGLKPRPTFSDFSSLSSKRPHVFPLEEVDFLPTLSDFSDGGLLEFHGSLARWNHLPTLSKPAEKGVLPASGNQMIALSPMSFDVETGSASARDSVQILDVREVMSKSSDGKALLKASVKFNQSFGESHEGTKFGLTLSAFRGNSANQLTPVAAKREDLRGDLDPRTWEALSAEIELPGETDYVVVSLSAAKNGPDAVFANSCSYYSDDLELSLVLGNRSTLGPI